MVERPNIPNTLNREFAVSAPNQVWCGDITYIWPQGKWHDFVAVLDLYARRVVGLALPYAADRSTSSVFRCIFCDTGVTLNSIQLTRTIIYVMIASR